MTKLRTLPLAIDELESRYLEDGVAITRGLLSQLRRDPRKGAQRLYERLRKRQDAGRRERLRVRRMRSFERALWASGVSRVAGVDEVGIGPMAGPVVAAAVVFPAGTAIDGIDDSKKLSPDAREAFEREISASATAVGIGVVEVPDVDRLNVYYAGLLAMRRAVGSLSVEPEHVLVDARTIPDLPAPQTSLTRGDTLSFSIAAASIVAKVYRDRVMLELDDQFPDYGFRSHKGYCSPLHQEAVRRLGPSPVHRQSFDFIRELRGEYDPAFYDLRDEVAMLRTRADLLRWDDRFEAARGRMNPRALRKLRALALRRSRQMGWI